MLSRALPAVALVAILAAGLTLLLEADVGAQGGGNIFENPQNLKVLPQDISPEALRETMKSAAVGLGVRCWFCHVGEEGQDLATFDFVSDEKAHKEMSRVMFQMVMDINGTYMPKIAELEGEGETEDVAKVRCVTCHAGKPYPGAE
jgi:hypothetical protein